MTASSDVPAGLASADRVLEITRVFDAPRSLVWQVWTEPGHLRHWTVPGDLALTFCEIDLRPGGVGRCCMRAPDGTEHWLTQVYNEVIENERLVSSHAWDDAEGKPGHATVLTVTFEDADGGTRVTLRQTGFDSIASRDGHGEGWASCFDKFAAHVAKLQGGTP